jgi:hypothetical protein
MEQIVNESERREPMSQSDRSERIGFLRAAIARIEAGSAGAMGGLESAPSPASGAAGWTGADWAGADWAARGLFCEVAPAAAHDHGAASGFALALAARCAREAGGPVAWIAEDFAFLEWGAPYGPGLGTYGLGWRDLTLLRLPRRADVWLASEEAIRARVFAAIVIEPAGLAGAEAPKILRRLAMGARAAGARAILLRPPACARLPFLAPSSLRFEVAARSAPRPAAGRRPLPGQGAWRVRCAAPAGRLALQPGDVFRDVDLAPVEPIVPPDLASPFPAPSAVKEDFIGVALSLRSSAGLAGRAA